MRPQGSTLPDLTQSHHLRIYLPVATLRPWVRIPATVHIPCPTEFSRCYALARYNCHHVPAHDIR